MDLKVSAVVRSPARYLPSDFFFFLHFKAVTVASVWLSLYILLKEKKSQNTLEESKAGFLD